MVGGAVAVPQWSSPKTRWGGVFTEHLCPGPLHCRRGAPADFPLPFSPPTCFQRAALLRPPLISPILLPTACTLLTTRDPTEPLCSGPVFPAEGNRLAMLPTDSRIAAIPSIWLGWLPRQCHRSIFDTPSLSRASRIRLSLLHRLPGDPNASETPSAGRVGGGRCDRVVFNGPKRGRQLAGR